MPSYEKLATGAGDDDVRVFFAIIADEATVMGFLLAGIGESFDADKKLYNYMMVNEETKVGDVENYFISLINLFNIGVVLVGEDLWKHIKPLLNMIKRNLPIVLKIPTRSSLTTPLMLKEQTAHIFKRQTININD